MGRNVVKAKLDVIFKKFFTRDKDLKTLSAFLEAVLDMPENSITKIQVLDTKLLPTRIDGKQGDLDLKVYMNDSVVNVEIQIEDERNYRDRSVYYWSKTYSDELKKGQDYNDLKPTICINIMNFKIFECEEAYSTFKLLETDRHEILTDKCAILFFELKKINDKIEPNNRKKLWLQLINAETEEELDMLNETGVPEIQKAVVTLREMSQDEEIQEMARLREKWIMDHNSAMRNAERKGMEKGIEKGMEKGRQEGIEKMIAAMREMGMSEQQIQAAVNLAQGKQ